MPIPRALLLAALLAGAVFLASCNEAGSPPAEATAQTGSHDEAGHEEEEGEELAPYMASLQRYAEKLYLAGSNESWELAHFYGEELNEVAEEVAGGGFTEDGHDVSALMRTMLLPAVAQVEAAADGRSAEAFDAAYGALITACNACHDATEHGFITLRVPDANAYPSQDFTP